MRRSTLALALMLGCAACANDSADDAATSAGSLSSGVSSVGGSGGSAATDSTGDSDGGTGGSGGTASTGDTGASGTSGASTTAGTGATTGSSTGATATAGTSSTDGTGGSTSGGETSATATSTSTSGTGTSTTGGDPLDQARQICVDKINALRATKGAPVYARWTGAEACSDTQVTSDEQANDPHGNFGQCGESAQNECLGQGVDGIEQCLDQMWAEKDQPGCSGCDACADAYDENCPNCDFYGNQTGDVCGHYVNMRALYFSEAACGFSTIGDWDVINFR